MLVNIAIADGKSVLHDKNERVERALSLVAQAVRKGHTATVQPARSPEKPKAKSKK